MTWNDLLLVGRDGDVRELSFPSSPTTDDIVLARDGEKYAVQKVGEVFEVYDLDRLTVYFGSNCLPLPKCRSEDEDIAVAWAIGNVWAGVSN